MNTGRSVDTAATVRLLAVQDDPLSVDVVLAAVADPAAGGTCVFVGSVRDLDQDKAVTGLGYEAHPSDRKSVV